MTDNPTLALLEDEERHARNRLAIFRARVYASERPSAMADQQRLNELERAWEFAAKRLRKARERQPV